MGRGPTKLISPRRTFKSWGSSSRLVLRNTRPTRVTRGSLRNFWFLSHSARAPRSPHVHGRRSPVQAGLAQHTTNTGNAGITAQLLVPLPLRARPGIALQKVGQQRIGVRVHRPELPAPKVLAPAAQALLPVEHRSRRIQLDQGHYSEQQRAYEQPAHHNPKQVQSTFGS